MPESVNGIDNLDELTIAQKAVAALDLLPQLIEKIEKQKTPKTGPGRPVNTVRKAAGEAAVIVGIGRSSVEAAITIRKRDPDVIERMRTGELNVAQAAREVGLIARGGRTRWPAVGSVSAERDAVGRQIPLTYYGKGDKWKEAVGPLLRYLSAWEKRSYEFRHVAPKEARRRLALIEELQTKLDAAKVDLEQRAHSATLTIKKG